MVKRTVLKAIDHLRECLEREGLNISNIILFGSHAQGTATKDSDVDIIILSNDFRGQNIFDRVKILAAPRWENVRKHPMPMDIILKTPEEIESGMLAPYAKRGVVVYESKNETRPKKLKTTA